MTAEGVAQRYGDFGGGMFSQRFSTDDVIIALKEFAEFHVKAALEAASKSVKYNRPYIEVKDSILNAYPLENIK